MQRAYFLRNCTLIIVRHKGYLPCRYNNTVSFADFFCHASEGYYRVGIEIGNHNNHKKRGYPTFTIAAPIDINGQRCIVAIVIKKTNRNRYKAHRVVGIDGKKFRLEKNKESIPTTGSGTNKSLVSNLPIGTDSKNCIPHNQPFNNTNIDKNASVDLGAVHSAVASSYSNVQARYRVDCVEEYGGISFARADVD